MENLGIGDYGIAVGVMFYIVRELLKIIAARKNGGSSPDAYADKIRREYLRPIREQVNDLWEWHNIRDRDGVPIWYVRPSLADAIGSLSDNIVQQTKILENIARITQETLENVK